MMEAGELAKKLTALERADLNYNEAITMAEQYRVEREKLRAQLLKEVPSLRYFTNVSNVGRPTKGSTLAKARVARIQVAGVQANRDKGTKNQADCMAIVEQLNGSATTRQVCDVTGLSDGTVYKHLCGLVKAGKLFRVPTRGSKTGKPYVFVTSNKLHALPKDQQDAARHDAHVAASVAT
jgi:hypothetical protein